MSKITCDMCMDLIPLVRDGSASEYSINSVMQHIEHCDSCRNFYSEKLPPGSDMMKAFRRLKNQVRLFFIVLMMLGIFYGLVLTNDQEVFYNSLIMPVVGVLGYVVFRWRSLYNLPSLLLITHVILGLLSIIPDYESLDFYTKIQSVLMWTSIYSIFALSGTLVAGLLHYAFGKDEKYEK